MSSTNNRFREFTSSGALARPLLHIMVESTRDNKLKRCFASRKRVGTHNHLWGESPQCLAHKATSRQMDHNLIVVPPAYIKQICMNPSWSFDLRIYRIKLRPVKKHNYLWPPWPLGICWLVQGPSGQNYPKGHECIQFEINNGGYNRQDFPDQKFVVHALIV